MGLFRSSPKSVRGLKAGCAVASPNHGLVVNTLSVEIRKNVIVLVDLVRVILLENTFRIAIKAPRIW